MSLAAMTNPRFCVSSGLTATVMAASPNSRPSRVSVSFTRAFLPVGAGFFIPW